MRLLHAHAKAAAGAARPAAAFETRRVSPSNLLLLRQLLRELRHLRGALVDALAQSDDALKVACGLRRLFEVDDVRLFKYRVPREGVDQRVERRDRRPQRFG